jgi:hypothetical protein
MINNAAAPLRIKREFIEAEGENMEVEANSGNSGNVEVVGVFQPTFQQTGEGREEDPLVDIRNLFRERMVGGGRLHPPQAGQQIQHGEGLAPEDDPLQRAPARHPCGGGAQGGSLLSGRRQNAVQQQQLQTGQGEERLLLL